MNRGEAHRAGGRTRWASRSEGSFDPPYDGSRRCRVRIADLVGTSAVRSRKSDQNRHHREEQSERMSTIIVPIVCRGLTDHNLAE
jgi:hypothetical protein